MRPEEEAALLILAAQREGNRLMASALRPLGVTPAQAEVLQVLAHRQPLTLTGLGELLVCESGTNPSRLIDRLVTAGLVRRAESGQDRRQVELSLTPDGHGKARQVDAIKEQMYQLMDGADVGYDIQQVLGYLRALVQGRPSGLAIDRRTGRQPHTSQLPHTLRDLANHKNDSN
jgi:MarR family transcriptional regulator, organic hydroperoxide resistance regulator